MMLLRRIPYHAACHQRDTSDSYIPIRIGEWGGILYTVGNYAKSAARVRLGPPADAPGP